MHKINAEDASLINRAEAIVNPVFEANLGSEGLLSATDAFAGFAVAPAPALALAQ